LYMKFEYYVFFEIEVAKLDKIISELMNIPQLKELVLITGQYDLIAKFETENPEELRKVLVETISSIPGVKHTVTATVIERYR